MNRTDTRLIELVSITCQLFVKTRRYKTQNVPYRYNWNVDVTGNDFANDRPSH